MLITIVKVVVSALVIALVTGLARLFPGIAGWIAALPIVSVLSAIWLIMGHQPLNDVIQFLMGVLKGLLPTAVLLIVMIICLRRGLPFVPSLCASIVGWLGSSFMLGRIGF